MISRSSGGSNYIKEGFMLNKNIKLPVTRKIFALPFLGLTLLFLFGCASPPQINTQRVAKISASAYTNNLIAKAPDAILPEYKINVGNFSSFNPDLELFCRLKTNKMALPGGESLEEYVRKSFIRALSDAGYYSPIAKDSIKGHIVSFSNRNPVFGYAFMKIGITLSMPDGSQVEGFVDYWWPAKVTGSTACGEMENNIPIVVNNLIKNTTNKLKFKSLLLKRQELSAATKKQKTIASNRPKRDNPRLKKERLVVLQVHGKGISKQDRVAYRAALVKALQNKYDVLSGDQVDKIARETFAKESKESLECDTEKCFQNIAIALQAELIASCNVNKKSGGYILTLQVNNVLENRTIISESNSCRGCDEFQVIDQLKLIVGDNIN